MILAGGLLLSEIVVLAAGVGLTALLPSGRPLSRMEFAGLALMLRSAVVSLLLFGLSWCLHGVPLIAAIALISLALGVVGALRLRRRDFAPLAGSKKVALALIPLLAIVAWQAVNHPLYADGLFNFEIRAQLAALHGGQIPLGFYTDPARGWMHPDYPLFLPMNQAWVYLCLGGAHQGFLQLLSIHFVAAAVCLLYSGVARLTGDWRPATVAIGLLVLLPSAMISPGGATSLWGDFPLSVVFLGAVIYLVEFAATGGALFQLATFLALLPWMKREGLVLAGILTIVAAWVAWRRGQWRPLAVALLPMVCVILGWKAFLLGVHVTVTQDFLPVTPANFFEHADRLQFILTALIRELLSWKRWSILWPMAVVAMVMIFRQPALARWRLLGAVIVIPIGLYTVIYVFSVWASLPLHIVTSLPRLLLPIAMPAIVAVAVGMGCFVREPAKEEPPSSDA